MKWWFSIINAWNPLLINYCPWNLKNHLKIHVDCEFGVPKYSNLPAWAICCCCYIISKIIGYSKIGKIASCEFWNNFVYLRRRQSESGTDFPQIALFWGELQIYCERCQNMTGKILDSHRRTQPIQNFQVKKATFFVSGSITLATHTVVQRVQFIIDACLETLRVILSVHEFSKRLKLS